MSHEDWQTVNETFGYENSFYLGIPPPPPKKKTRSHPHPQSTPLPGLSSTAARDTRGMAKRNN